MTIPAHTPSEIHEAIATLRAVIVLAARNTSGDVQIASAGIGPMQATARMPAFLLTDILNAAELSFAQKARA